MLLAGVDCEVMLSLTEALLAEAAARTGAGVLDSAR